MKKVLIIIAVIIMLLSYGIYRLFYDMSSLPKGQLISEVQSPEGTYTLKAYRINGGATVAFAIRGELNFNTSTTESKNIYWNYREDKADIKWFDDNTVIINGHKLKVPNEVYDFRKNN